MLMTELDSSKYTRLIEEQIAQDRQISDWQMDLSRLVRRGEIYKQLGSNLPLNEIKAIVREYEKSLGIGKLVEGLVTKEFVISPRVAALAVELRSKLSEFGFLDCLVLQGSAVNGGGVIRTVTSGKDSHDLDWGIIFNGEEGPSDDNLKKMVTKANRLIPRLAKKYDLGADFRSCRGEKSVNPLEGCYMPRLKDLEHAKYMWRHFNGGSANIKDLILYFQPSFPQISNVENRRLLLEALSSFSGDNQFFTRIIDKFLKGWSDFHIIKDKHLEAVGPNPKKLYLKENTVENRGFVMQGICVQKR